MFTQEDELKFVIEPQITPYCGPLFFARPDDSEPVVTANGSFGLVDTGSRKLLVTCLHVWDGFQQQQAENPSLRILVCLARNRPIVLPMEPISQNRKLDIATFDLEPLEAAYGGRRFFPLSSIYSRPEKGDTLFFVGYPGCFRHVSSTAVEFGRVAYAVNLTGVDGQRFYSNISKAKRVYVRQPKTAIESDPHPGISGSPCFVVRADRPAKLVGFTTSIWTDLLWFTHAGCLNQDGTIEGMPERR